MSCNTRLMGSSGCGIALRYPELTMRAPVKDHASTFVWSYVFGPFLAILPARWRAMWFGDRDIAWRQATIISGILQFFVWGPFLLLLSVFYVQGSILGGLMDMFGHSSGPGIPGDQLSLFSLIAAGVHPIVLVSFYLFMEGAGRVFAASITNEYPGTLVLYGADALYLFLKGKVSPAPPVVPDQVTKNVTREGWVLQIESSRPKRDWDIGRLLLYKENYYRIESFAEGSGPRPYVFLLKSLPAGARTRSVILYSTEEVSSQASLSPQRP